MRRLIDLPQERLRRRPVYLRWGGRRFRITRPGLAAWVRWWSQ